jgi:two-component system, OmpR family, heavy metal sensor histidine kinase CusS
MPNLTRIPARQSLSFRLRIALSSAAVSGAVLIAFSTAAYFMVSRERLAGVDLEIRALAQRHPGWMGGGANQERWVVGMESMLGEERSPHLILMLKDASGHIRYRSPHWPLDLDPEALDLTLADAATRPRHAPADPEPFRRGAGGRRGPPWTIEPDLGEPLGPGAGRRRGRVFAPLELTKVPRFLTVQTAEADWRMGILGDNGTRLLLGLNLSQVQTEFRRLRDRFLVGVPLALCLIGWGGWWVAGRAVRPLRSIAQVAEGMTARGLDQRIPPSDDDPEIARLVRVLNGMMDRLEVSFRQATRFSADASHELKTPLAVMQGELEHALQSAAVGTPEQQLFANLLEETQRLKSITHSLLLLAQADAGRLPLAPARLDLSSALMELIEDVEVLAAEQRLRLELDLPPGLWVQADWPLLRQAILNLLHNSLRHNELNGWIRVQMAGCSGFVELRVSNSGPPIPADAQPRLFDRFFRVDAARDQGVRGAGLGLSLAREIVRAHNGTLRLEESGAQRTAFLLSLPSAPGAG